MLSYLILHTYPLQNRRPCMLMCGNTNLRLHYLYLAMMRFYSIELSRSLGRSILLREGQYTASYTGITLWKRHYYSRSAAMEMLCFVKTCMAISACFALGFEPLLKKKAAQNGQPVQSSQIKS